MKTGLVMIDMLNDFHDGVRGNPAVAGIVESIKSLIEAARDSEEWVVIYGNDAHKPGDLEFKVFGEHALAGSDGPGSRGALLPPSPLRTVRDSFPSHSSSPSKANLGIEVTR